MNGNAFLRYVVLPRLHRSPRFPAQAVELADLRRGLDVYLHGLGDSVRCRVVGQGQAGPSFLPRLALSLERLWAELAWRDAEQAHLPQRAQRFPESELNRDLLFWLAAFLSTKTPRAIDDTLTTGVSHLLSGVATSRHLLARYPGLRPRYRRLCQAYLGQRETIVPAPPSGGDHPAHLLETALRHALGAAEAPAHPWLAEALRAAQAGAALPEPDPLFSHRWIPFWPVPLWSHPLPPARGLTVKWWKRQRRPSERGRRQPLARPRVDRMQESEIFLGAGIRSEHVYPEWDYRQQRYRADHCRVTEQRPPAAASARLEGHWRHLARQVRRQFEALRQQERWQSRLRSGEELDIDAFVSAVGERRGSGYMNERLYRQQRPAGREMAVSVLLDTSRSTQAWLGEQRVIGIGQHALVLLAEALAQLRDEFALYAFFSDSRYNVHCLSIKDFEENYDDGTQRRILGLQPNSYTRMGAAIRHLGQALARRPARHKLLLVITDGRPHDPTDDYVGRYAFEDTRRALIEMRHKGLHTFGLTIDHQGREYLPFLFGPGRYLVFSDATALPEYLPRLYAHLTGRGSAY